MGPSLTHADGQPRVRPGRGDVGEASSFATCFRCCGLVSPAKCEVSKAGDPVRPGERPSTSPRSCHVLVAALKPRVPTRLDLETGRLRAGLTRWHLCAQERRRRSPVLRLPAGTAQLTRASGKASSDPLKAGVSGGTCTVTVPSPGHRGNHIGPTRVRLRCGECISSSSSWGRSPHPPCPPRVAQ